MDRWEEDYLLGKGNHLGELNFNKNSIMDTKKINHSIQEYFDGDYIYVRPHQIKDFIYDEILPEVLESIMPWNWDKQWDEYDGNTIKEEIKNIAKKQYNINL